MLVCIRVILAGKTNKTSAIGFYGCGILLVTIALFVYLTGNGQTNFNGEL